MARDRTPAPLPNALVASAALLNERRIDHLPDPEKWQHEFWQRYDDTPEVRFACGYLENAGTRVRLLAATRGNTGDEPAPVENGPAYDLMEQLAGGTDGQSQMMGDFFVHLTGPGKCYLAGEPSKAMGATDAQPTAGPDTWQVLSQDELEVDQSRTRGDATRYRVKIGDGNQDYRPLADDALVCDVWRSHKRRKWKPDSPHRATLKVLRELNLMTAHVEASGLSRLAGAGILFIPNEVVFPVSEKNANAEDPFVAELIDVMLTAIKNRDNASAVVPLVVRVPGDLVDKIKHVTFSTPFDEQAITLRGEAIRRYATGVDLPAEIVTGLGDSNHWCVDDDTEVLTADGWRSQSALEVGDEVLTLNHETGRSEWGPVLDIYRAEVTDEPMLLMERRWHSSLTTANHRWPTIRNLTGERRITQTGQMDREDLVVTAAPCADLPDEAKHTDAMVELVAWWWTEDNDGLTATIAQSHTVNPERVARIDAALTRLFGVAAEGSMCGLDGPAWRRVVQENRSSFGGPVTVFRLNRVAAAVLREVAPAKRVSPEFVRSLTAAQLELFIDVSCQGDGQHYRSGRLDIWQARPDDLDAFELAMILSGRTVVRGDDGRRVAAHPGRSTTRPCKSRDGDVQPTTVPYSGVLWCPVTANTTWMARRHGTVYFTGNTAWQISEDALKLHIEPMSEASCLGLTKGYLQPALRALGRPESEVRDTIVWYDTTQLKVRPDRSGDAKDVYDRLGITLEALRRETGFDEADRPMGEEAKVMLALKLIEAVPTLADTLLPVLFPGLQIAPQPPRITITEQGGPPTKIEPTEGTPTPNGPPNTQNTPPPAPNGQSPVAAAAGPVVIESPARDHAAEVIESGLLAACDGLVLRALERAGGRLTNRARAAGMQLGGEADTRHLAASEEMRVASIDYVMEGAWSRVPIVAERYGIEPVALTAALDTYVRGLVLAGLPHEFARLAEVLGVEQGDH